MGTMDHWSKLVKRTVAIVGVLVVKFSSLNGTSFDCGYKYKRQ